MYSYPSGILMEENQFSVLGLNKQLCNAIEDQGYSKPTEIQLEAIPQLLNGQDVLGIAQTGTGKTAAYALPILMKCKYAQGMDPRALILAPTRELVMQISEVFRQLSKYTDLRIVELYGGVGPKSQIENIEKGVDIIISTPGRFTELYIKEIFKVKMIKHLILDEADKMMDMGFMPQIRKILEFIPYKKRQNGLFSATFPEKVENLSHEFLEFPIKIEITPQATPAEKVTQRVYKVPNQATKINALKNFFGSEEFQRVIIFCRSKVIANTVYEALLRSRTLREKDLRVIHSNKGQNTRINSMQLFRDGELRCLITTDVVARGIDIPLVSHVVNFDVPLIYEDYVHRIGRTGRAEQTGESISFILDSELYHWEKILAIIQQDIQPIPLPKEIIEEKTSFLEQQDMLREIDNQKKKEDPTFKGAFHEKKRKFPSPNQRKFNSSSNKRRGRKR